jgi:alkyl sulfatase BDS1-like metallo-beta-lactamase superfamily hydrolase
MKLIRVLFTAIIALFFLSACATDYTGYEENADSWGFTAPTAHTIEKNKVFAEKLAIDNAQDFDDARRGLIAVPEKLTVMGDDGEVLRNMEEFAFLDAEEVPSSVNPSLWRQARLNNIHGLFEVTPCIYQIRGFDISNMTIINGKSGWIIVDTLTTRETGAAAIAFARKNLEPRPISAIIFTHSHIDHFGGVLGVISSEEAAQNNVRIIAPEGFMKESTSENIMTGTVMSRRAGYQFGKDLPASERGYVDTGLGSRIPFGTYGILAPTDIVDHAPQEMTIDGVKFVFQYTPESEAPAELTFYLPDYKTYCGAEILTHNMHNLYTLRGTKTRDALKWSGYINEAMELFGEAEIFIASHHWPIWGNDRVRDFLEKQRDLYKFMHDQTLRLANNGYTPKEIAEQIALPEALDREFYNRGYYGTLSHNSKAVYQHYLGWYDGNPANLNPLPPEASARRYVAYMGGADNILEMASQSFENGEYRWVAEVLNHLIFADPGNKNARILLAKTYDQLGYQAESGVWRSVYLSAAYELRHGAPEKGLSLSKARELLKRTPPERFFDTISVRLSGPRAEGKQMVINVNFTDLGENHVLSLKNAVLHHKPAALDPDADVTLEITYDLFIRILIGEAGLRETIFSDDLNIAGSRMDLLGFLMMLEKPDNNFNLIEP